MESDTIQSGTTGLLRVGDAERSDVVDELAEHYAAGRLSRAEFDQRSADTLAARTRDDLTRVLEDLPARTEAVAQVEPDAVRRKAHLLWTRAGLAPWALFIGVFIVIWAMTGAGYFWPVWPIMGWGIAVVATGIVAHTVPDLYLQHQARHSGCLAGRR